MALELMSPVPKSTGSGLSSPSTIRDTGGEWYSLSTSSAVNCTHAFLIATPLGIPTPVNRTPTICKFPGSKTPSWPSSRSLLSLLIPPPTTVSSASSLVAATRTSTLRSPNAAFVPARVSTKTKEVKKINFLDIIVLLQKVKTISNNVLATHQNPDLSGLPSAGNFKQNDR
ncbi:hypothetical protein ES703_69633 [subsurface metagenome]